MWRSEGCSCALAHVGLSILETADVSSGQSGSDLALAPSTIDPVQGSNGALHRDLAVPQRLHKRPDGTAVPDSTEGHHGRALDLSLPHLHRLDERRDSGGIADGPQGPGRCPPHKLRFIIQCTHQGLNSATVPDPAKGLGRPPSDEERRILAQHPCEGPHSKGIADHAKGHDCGAGDEVVLVA